MNQLNSLRVFVALSALSLCVACGVMEKDYDAGKSWAERGGKTIVITASVEDPTDATKTFLDGTHVVWQAGDKIKVFDALHPSGVEFSLVSNFDGQRVASFVGSEMAATGPYYAVYPASVAGTLEGEKMNITLPQSQTLSAGSFGNGASIAVAVTDDLMQGFSFKNILGAVKVSLSSGIDATGVRIETKGDEALWGQATVTLESGEPSLTLSNPDPARQIVEATGAASGSEFYVMLPPDALAAGYVVQVTNNENYTTWMASQASENTKVVRAGIMSIPAFAYEARIISSFLNLTPDTGNLVYGYYSGINAGGNWQPFVFSKATGHYAHVVEDSIRYFRVQDFSVAKMYEFAVPAGMELGDSSDSITVVSVVGSTFTEPTEGTFTLVQKTADAGWFVSADNTTGFVLLMEN